MGEYALIIIGAAFVNNVVLAKFLGLCPFVGVSNRLQSAAGLGGATAMVLTLACVLAWVAEHWVLRPLEAPALRTVIYIFIIAVAIEEFGLIVFIIILTLYVIILLRTLSRLLIERNPFLLLVGLGLLTIIQTQALINLGVAARLLPTKGMTLPFISYGGSSMVAMGILMGLLLNVTRRRTSENIDSFMGGT